MESHLPQATSWFLKPKPTTLSLYLHSLLLLPFHFLISVKKKEKTKKKNSILLWRVFCLWFTKQSREAKLEANTSVFHQDLLSATTSAWLRCTLKLRTIPFGIRQHPTKCFTIIMKITEFLTADITLLETLVMVFIPPR